MWFRESVNLIDTCAFMGCSGLKAIEFKSSMRLGPKAFSGTNLRGYDLTKGVAIFCSLWTPPVLADSTVFDSTHYANSVIKVPYSRVEHYRNTENWGRFTNIRSMPYDFKEGNIYYRINNENEVGVSAIRGGTIPGIHQVMYCGEDEVLEFKHTAYSRRIFATGAVKAAKWLLNQKPGFYDMNDVLFGNNK